MRKEDYPVRPIRNDEMTRKLEGPRDNAHFTFGHVAAFKDRSVTVA